MPERASEMVPPDASRVRLWIATIVLAASAVWFGARVALPSLTTVTHGYASYYTASVLLVRGELDLRIYDDRWFGAQVQTVTHTNVFDVATYNPPTYSLILFPFAALDARRARGVWIVFNLALLPVLFVFLKGVVGGARVAAPPHVWLYFGALLLLSGPVVANIRLGQSYLLMFLGLLAALWAFRVERDLVAGGALAFVMVMKFAAPLVWLVPLVKWRPRAILSGGLIVLAIALGTLPWIGIDTWLAYPEKTLEALASPVSSVTAYQTTRSLALHLLAYSEHGNPEPLQDWPLAATAIPILVGAAAIGATAWRGVRAPIIPLFAALISLSVILLPIAEEHVYIWMVVPLALFLSAWQRGALGNGQTILALAAAGLILLPLPYEAPVLSVGARALLAYPRVYGGWMAWALSFMLMRPSPSDLRPV